MVNSGCRMFKVNYIGYLYSGFSNITNACVPLKFKSVPQGNGKQQYWLQIK